MVKEKLISKMSKDGFIKLRFKFKVKLKDGNVGWVKNEKFVII